MAAALMKTTLAERRGSITSPDRPRRASVSGTVVSSPLKSDGPYDDTLGPVVEDTNGTRNTPAKRVRERDEADIVISSTEIARDKAQALSDELMRRIQFNHTPHNYEELPLQPGIAFYRLLAPAPAGSRDEQRRKEGRLKLLIPDTIVFSGDKRPMWFYTSVDGYVYRTDDGTERHIMTKVGETDERLHDNLVAVLKKPETQPCKTAITLLNTRLLSNTLASPQQGLYAIQKFVNFKGNKASVYRIVWSGKRGCVGFVITNNMLTSDIAEADFRKRYCVNTKESSATSVFKLSGEALKSLTVQVTGIVRFVENSFKPRIHFEQIVVDFVKDREGNWWFLQVKHFTLADRTIEHLNNHARMMSMVDEDGNPLHKAEGNGKGKDYLLFQSCHCCKTRCNNDELNYELSQKMILETVQHMQKRGVTLRFFKMIEGSTVIENDSARLYAPMKVCKSCYDMYSTEQKLKKLSITFARSIGVPITEEQEDAKPYNVKSWTRRGTSEEKTLPKEWDFTQIAAIPSAFANDSYRPPNMSVYRFITFFHEMYDTPDLVELFGQDSYALEYTILNVTTRMPLQLVEGAVIPVHKLRVFHFFADEDGLKAFLESQQKIDIKLMSLSRTKPLSSTSLYLKQFQSGVISKLDYFQLFSTREMAECGLKVTIGFTKMRAIDSTEFEMYSHNGVYVPNDPAYFCTEPLPDEWMRILPNKKGFLESLPPSTRAPRRQWGVRSRNRGTGLNSPAPELNDSLRASGVDASLPVNEMLSPEERTRRRLTNLSEKYTKRDYDTANEERKWLVKLMIHQVTFLRGTPRENWVVNYSLFGEEFITDVVQFNPATSAISFNTTDDINLHCTHSGLRRWLDRYPIASFEVTSKDRNASGTLNLSLADLFTRGQLVGAYDLKNLQGNIGTDRRPPCISVSVYLIDPEDEAAAAARHRGNAGHLDRLSALAGEGRVSVRDDHSSDSGSRRSSQAGTSPSRRPAPASGAGGSRDTTSPDRSPPRGAAMTLEEESFNSEDVLSV